jgi:RimJ/RimL family protein N-acetyltransferase
LRWRNDPVAARFSRTGVIDPADHARWWTARTEDPGCQLCIAEVDGRAVGSSRVDVDDAVGTVSVVLDPEMRGRGLGSALVAAVAAQAELDPQVVQLRALVHPDNEASRRTFTGAGFLPDGTDDGFLRFLLEAAP